MEKSSAGGSYWESEGCCLTAFNRSKAIFLAVFGPLSEIQITGNTFPPVLIPTAVERPTGNRFSRTRL